MVAGTSEETGEPSTTSRSSRTTAPTVHIYEKYADSDAMIAHVNGFMEKWVGRFIGCVDVDASSPPTATLTSRLRRSIEPFGGKLLGTWGGFAP